MRYLILSFLCALGLTTGVQAAAVTTDFTSLSGGNDINIGGDFVADDLRIVSGNCAISPCAALNKNETTTIFRSTGLGFKLENFWYQLLGTKSELKVTYFDENGVALGSDFFSSSVNGNNDGGHTIVPSFSGEIFSVLFDDISKNAGNIRIDELSFEVEEMAVVPLPAAGLLFAAGLGALGFFRKHRTV